MEYTPQEVAKLLANRPHQPHYVEWLLEQVVAAERERCAARLQLAEYIIGAFERGADPREYGREIHEFRA